MTLQAKFGVGDRVLIVELNNTRAVVRQVCFSETGATYQVYWFHDGQRRDAWVFEDELQSRE